MRKGRKHFTPEEKVAILKRHLVDKVPVLELCEELGLRPTFFELSVVRHNREWDSRQISGAQIRASRRGTLFVLRGGPPQPARREDDGEESGHAEREERPDKEEGSVGLGNRSADSRPLHVDAGDDQFKERHEEEDDVSRSLSGQHQRSVQLDDNNGQHNQV
jgi:hypothetical protein